MNSARAVVLATICCLIGYVWVYGRGLARDVVRSDGYSYYVYVPSWLLYGDTTLTAVARDCCGGVYPPETGILRWPETRRWVNVHPIGVAIMQAPFFPLAHALTLWSNLTPNGFSLYYQHAVGLAGLFWISGGLWILRAFLLRSFPDSVVAVTILTILLATNLLHYATFDVSYSHLYSFVLFAAFLLLTAKWYERPTTRHSILIGVVAAMIVVTRHTNIVFLSMFPLYGRLERGRSKQLAVIATTAALVTVPQLAIYYQATGRPLVSAYGDLGFNWASPRLFDVLFGVTKGLFFWSPVLLLAVAGLVMLLRSNNRARPFVVPGLLFLAIHAYIIAAWWDWQLGGSYGSRGFVDTLPVFAIGLAAFVERFRLTALVLSGAMASLSVFQMLQYWYGIIPFNDTSWSLYREVFLRWR